MSFCRIKPQRQQLAVLAVGFICSFLSGSASACDYQRVDPSHTMCVYTPRSCGGKTLIREYSFCFSGNLTNSITYCREIIFFFPLVFKGASGMSCHDKQVILETHNRLRQMLALGQIRGQPPSLDMRELVGLLFDSFSDILYAENGGGKIVKNVK